MAQTRDLKWGLFILLTGVMLLGLVSCERPSLPVEVGPPTQAVLVEPSDRSSNIPVTTLLTWMESKRATSYDVYLGTTDPPPFKTSTNSTSVNPGQLDYSTIYYWRVDAKNEHGSVQGDLQIFTTAAK